MESVWKPNVEISPNCPRCGSSNTKFCYYNNYSLTQPRYFCKGCRRYWTKGGSLRNVPVGGGCRKNRRSNNNKALRQSIDGLNFKNSPQNCGVGGGGDATTNNNKQIISHCYDPRRTNNNSSSSSSSSVVADGPNIDLALVYANFLNQKPDSRDGDVVVVENSEHHQIQQVFDPSIENSSRLSNIQGGTISSTILHEEFGLINGCLNLPQQQPPLPPTTEHNFGEGNSNNSNTNNSQIMYLSEFDSMHVLHQKGNSRIIIEQCSSHDDDDSNNHINNFELPPLPSCDEVEASHDLLWSNPMMVNNHAFHQQATTITQPPPQPPLFGTEEVVREDDDDAELLIGNWSPFDLPKDA